MPCSPQAVTSSRTASTPLRCPATRGSPRPFAQRPLPSIITATCRGNLLGAGTALVVLTIRGGLLIRRWVGEGDVPRSHSQKFLLFARHQLVDFGNVAVGQFLHRVFRALFLVFGDFFFLPRG